MSIRGFELEVWKVALELFSQFGASAETEVSVLVDQAQVAEDGEAVRIWKSVLRALVSIRETDGLAAN